MTVNEVARQVCCVSLAVVVNTVTLCCVWSLKSRVPNFTFLDEIKSVVVVPREYIPAVQKGVEEALTEEWL